MNYEPFDFEKYKAGRKAVTRDGRVPEQLEGIKIASGLVIVGAIDGEFYTWEGDGKYYNDDTESVNDLFLLAEVREVWVAVEKKVDTLPCRSEEEVDKEVKNNPNLRKAKLIIYG